jgi:hypothetical protein
MSLFDFSEIISEAHPSIKNNLKKEGNRQLQTPNTYLDNFAGGLNGKLNDTRLKFEYSIQTKSIIPFSSDVEILNENNKHNKDNNFIFYLTLKIDGNKVLNILRGNINIKTENRKQSMFGSKKQYNIVSFTDIVWMYFLSEELMNNIFKKGKTYFYTIIDYYYIVVEKQLSIYVYLLNTKGQVLYNMIQILFVFNIFLKKNIDNDIINKFIEFVNTIDITKIDDIKYTYINFYIIMINKIIENINNTENVNFSIEINLFDYFNFFSIDKNSLKEEYKTKLTVDILKETFFKKNIIKFISNEYISSRINSEYDRGVLLRTSGNFFDKKKINKKNINKTLDIFFSKENEKKIVKSFIDYGTRFGFTRDLLYFILGGYTDTNYFVLTDLNKEDRNKLEKGKIKISRPINLFKKNGSSIIEEKEIIQYIKEKNDLKNHTIYKNEFKKMVCQIIIDIKKNKIKIEFMIPLNKYIILFSLNEKKFLKNKFNIDDEEVLKTFFFYSKKFLDKNNFKNYINIINFLEDKKNDQIISILKFINFYRNVFRYIKEDRLNIALEKLYATILGNITTPPKIPSSNPSMNNSMLIITYNEENKDYDFVDCIPILYREFINPHAFIVVGTQESGTKKIKEGLFIRSEATHYPHVLGEYLGMIGYGRALKESAHKLVKIKNLNVRMRIFYYTENVVNIVNTPNNNLKSIKITSKNSNIDEFGNTYFQTFYKGAIFFKMVINNGKNNTQKFIFVNTHLYFNEKNEKQGYEKRKQKFLQLVSKPVFTDGTNPNKKNLLELYQNNYNIFLFGDLRFSMSQLRDDLLKNNKLRSNLFKSITNKNTLTQHTYDRILYALTNINPLPTELYPSPIEHETYSFPDKSTHSMVSLSISLTDSILNATHHINPSNFPINRRTSFSENSNLSTSNLSTPNLRTSNSSTSNSSTPNENPFRNSINN